MADSGDGAVVGWNFGFSRGFRLTWKDTWELCAAIDALGSVGV